MRGTRRLTFQLTPLLDLLLIVLFAQFIDARESSQASAEQLEAERAELALSREQFDSEQEQRRSMLEGEYQQKAADLENQRKDYAARFDSVLAGHVAASEILTDALQLPQAAVREVLKLRSAGAVTEAAQLQSAAESLRSAIRENSQATIEFFVRYNEMQKHVTIWELFVQSNGKVQISDGTQNAAAEFTSSEDFAASVVRASKSLPEAKPLVLILFSYGDADARSRLAAETGMPQLVQLLRDDSGGIRWYDYSLVGYRATGPLLGERDP